MVQPRNKSHNTSNYFNQGIDSVFLIFLHVHKDEGHGKRCCKQARVAPGILVTGFQTFTICKFKSRRVCKIFQKIV